VARSNLERFGDENRINVVRGELEDYTLLERTLNEYEIEVVFHLAAQTIVTVANRSPLGTFESNIRGTWNILEAARRSPKVRRVIVASSDKAYGTQRELPYTEEASLVGLHPYDVSKSCADLICAAYAHSYRLPVCVTRCGNLYGGGDLNFNRIVPGTIRSIIRGERPIVRSDGKFVRDYFYVHDAAEAYLTLAERMESQPELLGQAFNFSNEEPVSVIDLVRRIAVVMGGENLEPIVQNEASNEIREQYLSSKKARAMLTWQPRFGLEHGLRATVDWYRDYLSVT
jgi:CDP-glucose 4,6-dehydratase